MIIFRSGSYETAKQPIQQFNVAEKLHQPGVDSEMLIQAENDRVCYINQGNAKVVTSKAETVYTEEYAIFIPKHVEYKILCEGSVPLQTIEVSVSPVSSQPQSTYSPTLFHEVKSVFAKHISKAARFETEPGEIIHELIGRFSGDSKNIGMAHVTLPKGGDKKTELHRHPILNEKADCEGKAFEECYLVIQGSARMQIEDEVDTLNSGDMVYIEPGRMHQLSNISETEDCLFLVISGPAWRPECMMYEALDNNMSLRNAQ